MRTNIVIDDELMAEAMKATGMKTKREVVDKALRELVQRHAQRQILELVGQDLIDPDYDVAEVRRNMTRESG